MNSTIQKLLHETEISLAGLRFAAEKFSSQLAPRFNIFDYLRNDEMGVSSCLAELLNPHGAHGQGRLFLDSFQGFILSPGTSADVLTVETEKIANGARRIDIFVQFANGAVLGIENKPWAGDQKNQLADYAEFIQKQANGRAWWLLYICNDEPTPESISPKLRQELEKRNHFKRIDYSSLAAWLESLVGRIPALVVQVFVQEFAKFIRRSINMESDMTTQSQVSEVVLKSPTNLENAFEISNSMGHIKSLLMTRLKENLEERLNDNSPSSKGISLADQHVWPNGSWWNVNPDKAHSGFHFRIETERLGALALSFEFERTGFNWFFWGIASHAAKRFDADEVKSKSIQQLMASARLSDGQSEWWTTWARAETALNVASDWRQSDPWLDIQREATDDHNMVTKIISLAQRVRDALNAAS